MIISASRRTDIPALYPEWFVNRLKAGEVLIPNPYSRKKVHRIQLNPDDVDCIAFWSKNPEPIIPYLREIDRMDYKYYFQYTITDYEKDVEPGVPGIEESMATFLLLSDMIGKNKMDWRFDPIFIDEKYSIPYHLDKFEMMCEWLHKAASRCIISFVDAYKGKPYMELESEDMLRLAEGISKIAKKYNLPVYTCSERVNLSMFGIEHGACIDPERIRKIIGYKLDIKKDAGQRKTCLCADSIDIGTYETCTNGCKYCYAVGNVDSALRRKMKHDPNSPILIGNLKGDEEIITREIRTNKDNQLSLFDLPEVFARF